MPLSIAVETNLNSDPCVIAWDDRLFVGTEDGSIKSFNAKLTPQESWAAHSVQLFALAAGGGHVYSASNDSGIKVWSPTGQKIAELPRTGGDVGVLQVFGKHLYAGDEIGNITVFENNTQKAKYNVLEEVKDLWYEPPFLYTARDLDVTITEIKPDDSKTRYMTRHTMEGRPPLRVAGGRLAVMARGGTRMRLHDASAQCSFKLLDEVKDLYDSHMCDSMKDAVWHHMNYVFYSGVSGETELGTIIPLPFRGLFDREDYLAQLECADPNALTMTVRISHRKREFYWMTWTVSDMIVTSMSVIGDTVWTGGWDGCVRRWAIAGDKVQAAGELNLGGCINGVCAASGGVFAAVSGGRVVYVV